MSANRAAAGAAQDAASKSSANEPRLLWNPDNVKDVAESVGIAALGDEALRTLSQDVEYRIGQVIIEALRFMRAAKRTTMTVQDISLALRVLDVEPLYGYESTRPLRYGEASLGPGQPLFYIEDEEVDFEKMINQPLPKVPRDTNFTGQYGTFVLPHTRKHELIRFIILQHTGSPSKACSPQYHKTRPRTKRNHKPCSPRALARTQH